MGGYKDTLPAKDVEPLTKGGGDTKKALPGEGVTAGVVSFGQYHLRVGIDNEWLSR
jgi:hypothetical protein